MNKTTRLKFKVSALNNRCASGVMLVGDAAGNNNAGVSGVVDATPGNSVRFWAGAPYADRNTAPYRVQQDGSFYSTKGKIGCLDIGVNDLRLGDESSWAANSNYITISESYFLYRKNGNVVGNKREVAFDLYSNQLGSPNTISFKVENSTENSGIFGGANVAVLGDAKNGNLNYAFYAGNGLSKFRGIENEVKISASGYTLTKDDYYVLITSGGNVFLPANPEEGRTVWVAKNTASTVTLQGNGKTIFVRNDGGNSAITLQWSMQLIYAGGAWRLLQQLV
ncbi:hypothetical protein [Pedobacter glucosidilyticus]|uniref:hypothetical protein n=1 Tax=Pedobacter glucosidilyticus TaxID=1122941 RepID=UPI00047A5C4F|nr:hypothetical protein [Pedobacter glucosidilyticus]